MLYSVGTFDISAHRRFHLPDRANPAYCRREDTGNPAEQAHGQSSLLAGALRRLPVALCGVLRVLSHPPPPCAFSPGSTKITSFIVSFVPHPPTSPDTHGSTVHTSHKSRYSPPTYYDSPQSRTTPSALILSSQPSLVSVDPPVALVHASVYYLSYGIYRGAPYCTLRGRQFRLVRRIIGNRICVLSLVRPVCRREQVRTQRARKKNLIWGSRGARCKGHCGARLE